MPAKPNASKILEEALLEGIDVDEDSEIFEAWRAEIRRRCADIDSGKTQLIESE